MSPVFSLYFSTFWMGIKWILCAFISSQFNVKRLSEISTPPWFGRKLTEAQKVCSFPLTHCILLFLVPFLLIHWKTCWPIYLDSHRRVACNLYILFAQSIVIFESLVTCNECIFLSRARNKSAHIANNWAFVSALTTSHQ